MTECPICTAPLESEGDDEGRKPTGCGDGETVHCWSHTLDCRWCVLMTPPAKEHLHIYPDLEQGTKEWHDQRRGMVTSSALGTLITAKTIKTAGNVHSRALTALLVAERITGHTDETYLGYDMERGWDDEPRAVEKYAKHNAPVQTVGFMVRDDYGFSVGFSPDGLVGDDGLIEVKSRRQKKHLQTVLADEVPPENMAQLQAGLFVSGREWCDYISYCGGMRLWVKRVTPDPRWFDAIVTAVAAFEKAAEEMADRYLKAVDGLPMTERIDNNLGLVF